MKVLEEQHSHSVLMILLKSPGLLKSELHNECIKTGASKNTVIKRINELVENKLIYAEQSKTHKSGRYLYLTDKGKKLAELSIQMLSVIENN